MMIGLELSDLAVDGAITKAPYGGDKAGPSPVDRRKGGLKRSTLTEATGIPLGLVSAPADRHDSPLLAPTLATLDQIGALPEQVTVHLDRGYDNKPTRQVLTDHGFDAKIAKRGVPAPVQAGNRWPVERTHAWMNGYGKLRRCTDRQAAIVDFYLYLAAALVTVRALIREAPPTTAGTTAPPPAASDNAY
ncbi:transposase [Micromonospora sp. MP36]|nr:transposase [Micromonospora sp. MP36]